MVKPPAVAARSFSGSVGLVKVNPKKANPNVLGRDALSVVNAQSLTSLTRRRVDAWLAEERLQHIRREEELKLKAGMWKRLFSNSFRFRFRRFRFH